MRGRLLLLTLTTLSLLTASGGAQAGVIRYTGRKISQGSGAIVAKATTGAEAVGGGVAAAGAVTGSAVKNGAVDVGRGAKAAPGAIGRGTKSGAQTIWKAIW